VGACVVGSVACASVLEGASLRREAAWIVPIAWAWTLSAIAAAAAWRDRPLPAYLAVGVALGVRVWLVGAPPLLSDDLYRYLWEGHALANGVNPFVTAPADVVGLDEGLRARVNHPEVSSIYPPLARVWFRALDALGLGASGAQGAAALVDAGTAGAMAAWLRGRQRPTWPALLYALHPLPALESAVGAHLESVALFLLTSALLLAERRRFRAAAWMGVAATLTKVFPVLVLPALLRAVPARRRAAVVGVALVATGALALPVITAGPALFTGLQAYASRWSFNGAAYALVAPLAGDVTRSVLGGIGALVTLGAWVRWRDPARIWLAVGSAFVLLSPTVHPWYVSWALIPALLCERWGWALAAGSLLGSYAVLATLDPRTGAWTEPTWLLPLTGGAALAALAAELIARSRHASPRP
jgi:hypothetical protein